MYSSICLLFKDGNNGEVKLAVAYSSQSILCQFVVFSVGVADRTWIWNLELGTCDHSENNCCRNRRFSFSLVEQKTNLLESQAFTAQQYGVMWLEHLLLLGRNVQYMYFPKYTAVRSL